MDYYTGISDYCRDKIKKKTNTVFLKSLNVLQLDYVLSMDYSNWWVRMIKIFFFFSDAKIET